MVGLLIFHILLLYIILTLVEEIAQLLLESLESVEFGLAAVPGSPGFNLGYDSWAYPSIAKRHKIFYQFY